MYPWDTVEENKGNQQLRSLDDLLAERLQGKIARRVSRKAKEFGRLAKRANIAKRSAKPIDAQADAWGEAYKRHFWR
jgi:hypothetical protein